MQRSNKTNHDLLPAFIGYTKFLPLTRPYHVRHIHTMPLGSCVSTKTIPDRDCVHTQVKNGDFGAISITERSCTAPISKMEPHISDKFCATLWCNVNRYSHYSGSE